MFPFKRKRRTKGKELDINYDFLNKVSGSTAECPLKLYKQEVDPSALPDPLTGWTEITSQTVLDKLKAQNELTVSAVATDHSTVTWNGKTLTKTATLKVLDDFIGKVKGSVVENPHIYKIASNNGLCVPSNVNWIEHDQEWLDKLKTQNSINTQCATSVSGFTPQMLFSFNIIEMFERKYGAIPKETVAEKIAWLKSNLTQITCNWYGYGSNPTGNKAYLKSCQNGSWILETSNTATSPFLCVASNGGSVGIGNLLSSTNDGFVHFLAYTDASNGVTPSTIYTDYVSLELTLKAPESMITATNTLSDIVTDFTGKVAGSTTENANISRALSDLTIKSPSSFLSDVSQTGYDNLKTLNAICCYPTINSNGYIAQQLFSFNIVSAVEKQLGQPIPAVDKVQWCKDNVNKFQLDWYGYGSCPGGNYAQIALWNGTSWNTSVAEGVWTTVNSTVTHLTNIQTSVNSYITSDGMTSLITYTNASDGVTASTIYTDYIKLTIKLKYLPTYDFFTDSNTRRDAGLTDIVLVKRQIGDMTSDFTGKVSGSVVENPNITKSNNLQTNTVLLSPSSFGSESSQAVYNDILSLNGTSRSITVTSSGAIPQQLFQFNLIAIAEKQLGTSIPGADTASKVQWLKDNLSTMRIEWTGYGSCPSGNKAYLALYTTAWITVNSITTSSPSLIQDIETNVSNKIDSNGFANFLAYTDASDGVTPSVINTDYVKLTLTFKQDTVGYEYFTNNSAEISVTTNAKASAYLIECDLTPIATALYGGSNAALKSALKSIQADVYAMGSGSNVNQLGYKVEPKMFLDATSWVNVNGNFNVTSTITNSQTTILTSATCSRYIQTSNKLYFLVCSTYKSDGCIASEVNLDYVKIKVALKR